MVKRYPVFPVVIFWVLFGVDYQPQYSVRVSFPPASCTVSSGILNDMGGISVANVERIYGKEVVDKEFTPFNIIGFSSSLPEYSAYYLDTKLMLMSPLIMKIKPSFPSRLLGQGTHIYRLFDTDAGRVMVALSSLNCR
ncbi:MAG: hypothetical protein ABNH16_05070 [Thalassolituus sp.]|jgi:hypothetical protein